MPTMTLSMKRLMESGETQERIKSLIDGMGMSVESVEGDAVTIEFTPNRMDLMDTVGMIRALRLFGGRRMPKEKMYSVKVEPRLRINVARSVSKVMPAIAGIVAINVDMSHGKAEEMVEFTEKLSATFGRKRRKMSVGLHDLDKIHGAEITYAGEKSGYMVPLEGKEKMKYKDIIDTHAKGVEFGSILDKGVYPVLKDRDTTIALIPILNSDTTKVSGSTKNLFIDITGTSEVAVAQTARMLACSLIDAGAEVHPCAVFKGKKARLTPDMTQKTVNLRRSEVERTLGIAISEDKIITMANRMGYVAAKYGRSVMMELPQYRVDILSSQDIVEDIAIAYGYDKIVPQPVFGTSTGTPQEITEFANRVSDMMVGMGFNESMGMYITTEKAEFEMMGEAFDRKGTVILADSKSGSILRRSILPSLLSALSASAHDPMPQRMFEYGQVFSVDGQKVNEEHRIAFVAAGSKADFSEAKSHVKGVLLALGIKEIKFKESESKSLITGRQAKVFADGREIGVMGEVHPMVLNSFRIEEPVAMAELNVEQLITAVS